MIKYTFVSLGRFESIGLRFGGAGLGNILFPWARAIVYAKKYNLTRIKTTWINLKIGPFLRFERDKRVYSDLFNETDGLSGVKKFLILNFSNKVKVFSGMDRLFYVFKHEHNFIKSELLKIINPYHLNNSKKFNSNSIAVHIRMGDFKIPKDEDLLRDGHWNYRIPLVWYINIIQKICCETSLPIYIFSDGTDDELKDIFKLSNCSRIYFGSAISDMIAISNAKLLVASCSTFSMWASFLGQLPTIWFPGQMRQKIISDLSIFEGELDYNDKLPLSMIEMLQNA